MFELFVVACIAMRACEYITVPLAYDSEARCWQQAALVAGMVRGRHARIGTGMTYEAVCRPQAVAWVALPADWDQP